jgi:hypothetical protein
MGVVKAPWRALGSRGPLELLGQVALPWPFACSQDLRVDQDFAANRSRSHKVVSRVERSFPREPQDRPSAFRVPKTTRAEARMPDVPRLLVRWVGVDAVASLAGRGAAFGLRLSSMAPDCSWADDLHLTERTLEVRSLRIPEALSAVTPVGRDSWRATRLHVFSGVATFRG